MASMGANAGAASTAKAPIPSATIEFTTELSIRNGDTTVVGGGVSEDGKWVRYVIVSAQAY